MPLTDKDLAPLFLPGTIPLPSPFPAVGDLELVGVGEKFKGVDDPSKLVIVRRRIAPMTKVCWTILVEHVSAVLLTNGDELDCERAEWLFGSSVPILKRLIEEKARKGIVYVPEDAPVLMGVEFGTTASESASYPIPGMVGPCDHCHCHTFSYERIMGGPDKGQPDQSKSGSQPV
jgi:hypothetical protein